MMDDARREEILQARLERRGPPPEPDPPVADEVVIAVDGDITIIVPIPEPPTEIAEDEAKKPIS